MTAPSERLQEMQDIVFGILMHCRMLDGSLASEATITVTLDDAQIKALDRVHETLTMIGFREEDHRKLMRDKRMIVVLPKWQSGRVA
jgi:hypothetical protein